MPNGPIQRKAQNPTSVKPTPPGSAPKPVPTPTLTGLSRGGTDPDAPLNAIPSVTGAPKMGNF